MKIIQKNIKVSSIFRSYVDKGDDGIFAYGGTLAVRPPYQREFVYNHNQSEEVIQTVLKGFPLNVMYWVKNGENSYEVLDGQQRTLSLMQYLKHQFPITINDQKYYWDSLPDDQYNAIMNYELMIYICEGEESEKLSWFKIVNIAGVRLTDQELRNSVYTGTWLTDAKKYFSKRNGPAKAISDKYIKGDPKRQELLETALKGISEYHGIKDLTQYMSKHRNDTDADELWQYFQDVISWVQKIFPQYYSDMKGVHWCSLYNKHHNTSYNSAKIKSEEKRLHEDEDVQQTRNIYEFLLTKDNDPYAGKLLHLREFSKRDKLAAYSKQEGICPICQKHFEFDEMEGDHILPWSKGGHTIPDNCQMLCKSDNEKKSDKY